MLSRSSHYYDLLIQTQAVSSHTITILQFSCVDNLRTQRSDLSFKLIGNMARFTAEHITIPSPNKYGPSITKETFLVCRLDRNRRNEGLQRRWSICGGVGGMREGWVLGFWGQWASYRIIFRCASSERFLFMEFHHFFAFLTRCMFSKWHLKKNYIFIYSKW